MTYITAKQLAEIIRRTPARVRQLCKAGLIPGAIRPARDWLIPADSRPVIKRADGGIKTTV